MTDGSLVNRSVTHSEYSPDMAPETCLRIHDEALIVWLQQILRLQGQVPTVKTAYDSRVFAQSAEVEEGFPTKAALPLPSVVLTSLGVTPDASRWTRSEVRGGVRGEPIYKDDTQTTRLHFPWPTPWNLSYQVDLWTRTQQEMRILRTQIWSGFQGHPTQTILSVEFPEPYGCKDLYLDIERDDDTSLLETGEEERELRHTFTFSVHGWLFKAAVEVPTITGAHIILVDGDPNDESLRNWYCDHTNYSFDSETGVLTTVAESPDYTPPDRVLATWSFIDGQEM